MNNINTIENEVEKTLDSLNNFKKITTDPFFYTRLMVRLEKENEPHWITQIFEYRWLKPVFITLIILINIIAVVEFTYYNNEIARVNNNLIIDFTQNYNNTTTDYLVYTAE